MTKTKIQHYVPQVYLRYFASSDEKIHIFDKVSLETRHQHIRHVACQSYFYDVNFKKLIEDNTNNLDDFSDKEIEILKDLDEQYLENFFSRTIENDLPKYFNNILAAYNLILPDKYEGTKVFNKKQKFILSILITFQILRTKEFRNTVNQLYLSFVETILKKFHDFNLDGIKMEVKKELESLFHSSFIMNNELIEEIANIINNHIWIFGVNNTQIPFYTSDNPIVKKGHLENSFYSNSGLASKGVEIAYPINSKIILLMFEKTYFNHFRDRNLKFYKMKDEKKIKYYNSLQVFESNRQVFCKIDDFDLAKKMCTKYPKYRKENRDRFEIN